MVHGVELESTDIQGVVHHIPAAAGLAGHRVLQAAQAAVMEDVLLIVIPEAPQAHQHQIGGVDADGAVRRIHDDLVVAAIRSRIFSSGSPSSTSRIMLESWVRPMRQGTHLPQVWAWHRFRKFSAISTGHRPGGLAAIRRSMFRYSCSTTAWAAPGIFTSNLLMSVVPPSGQYRKIRHSEPYWC